MSHLVMAYTADTVLLVLVVPGVTVDNIAAINATVAVILPRPTPLSWPILAPWRVVTERRLEESEETQYLCEGGE